ncbi:hypothetical protein JCM14722_03550 [Pseudodesulfovibrio portus]|uniref:Radical SAM domain protein n=1 Tax=Pseudodesulfovibrio portus TaxID=231439 RepID=A0ABM8AN36_9BACT|nr:hypothetical protein JCM14722_03550 [Pseudodesulfovibrio portus]
MSILTKSNLVLRDLDILTSMDQSAISLSVAFDDENTRELLEANTMSTLARIEALKECKQAGLRVSAMICPVIPYVNDPIPILEKVTPFVNKIWVYGLSILDESETNWKNIDDLLKKKYPSEYSEMRNAIFDRTHHFWAELRAEILDACSRRSFDLSIHI